MSVRSGQPDCEHLRPRPDESVAERGARTIAKLLLSADCRRAAARGGWMQPFLKRSPSLSTGRGRALHRQRRSSPAASERGPPRASQEREPGISAVGRPGAARPSRRRDALRVVLRPWQRSCSLPPWRPARDAHLSLRGSSWSLWRSSWLSWCASSFSVRDRPSDGSLGRCGARSTAGFAGSDGPSRTTRRATRFRGAGAADIQRLFGAAARLRFDRVGQSGVT